VGTQAVHQYRVDAEHLAVNWHSGAAHVAVEAADHFLPEGYCTVGTAVDVRHLAPTPQGSTVTIRAVLVSQEDKLLTFEVTAEDAHGLIGQGTHQRYIANLERFEAKARARF